MARHDHPSDIERRNLLSNSRRQPERRTSPTPTRSVSLGHPSPITLGEAGAA